MASSIPKRNNTSKAFGTGMRRMREACGLRALDLAAQLRQLGLAWTPRCVVHVERGMGHITLAEAVAIAFYFDTSVADLLASPGKPVHLNSRVTLPVTGVRNLLGGKHVTRKRDKSGSKQKCTD